MKREWCHTWSSCRYIVIGYPDASNKDITQLKKCRGMEIHGEIPYVHIIKKELTFWTDTVLKFLVYHYFVLFYHFLVRHNRMLNTVLGVTIKLLE